jgi:hypothetical protein
MDKFTVRYAASTAAFSSREASWQWLSVARLSSTGWKALTMVLP